MSDIDEIKEALNSADGQLRFVHTFTHGRGVQVYCKTRKVGPLILAAEGETLADVLRMLGELVEKPDTTTPTTSPEQDESTEDQA